MLLRLAALALVLTALPASAAFLQQHAHWTVSDADPPDCMAINRPPEEFAVQPYAALAIRQGRNLGPRLFVFAWPGVFKYGERLTLDVGGSGPGAQVAVEAIDSHVVASRENLSPQQIAYLKETRLVSFEGAGMPQALIFDLSQLDAVMKSLAACVRQLR